MSFTWIWANAEGEKEKVIVCLCVVKFDGKETGFLVVARLINI